MTDPYDVERDEATGPVVRDKRRLDPVTGALREPAPAPAAPADAAPDAADLAEAADAADAGLGPVETMLGELQAQLTERTSDVQRVQAEYANYRRRVDRDRDVARELATAKVLGDLLPVLDDISRARDHDELVGGFKSVADALEAALAKQGLEVYGTPGEPFDPTVHEALTHGFSAEVSESTCVAILMPGYRLGERILRPARVAVADPEAPAPAEPAAAAADDPRD